MNFKSLIEWLEWIKCLHVKKIDLDLIRVECVAKRMNLLKPKWTVITVAGTNGKGSTVAGLESIYLEAGYRVGVFTSPFLFRFNEQIRLLGFEIDDETLCQAFERVEASRHEVSLTPFEFNTLAALDIFQSANLDVCILEVGLGGRLDAVNIIDADIAIVASIDIDHADWLGDTREKIAYEKAGIFRANKPAICGDYHPPQTLIEEAKKIGATLYCQNQQFGFETVGFMWNWWGEKNHYENLPEPRLLLQNMSTALMAVELLQIKLPVTQHAIVNAFQKVKLPGRIQVIEGKITQIYDVSHNPAAVLLLAKFLEKNPVSGKTYAVFSMLADKDISGTISVIKNNIDQWNIAALDSERAASIDMILEKLQQEKISNFNQYVTIKEAYDAVFKQAKSKDRIVIFGSFHTVADVLKQ